MAERNQEIETDDDTFDPIIGDLSDEILREMGPISSEKQRLVQKRRLAEQRLEERRMRDELGDYDLELSEH